MFKKIKIPKSTSGSVFVFVLILSSCTSSPVSPPAHLFVEHGEGAVFETPEQATDALIAANRSGNTAVLLKILGPDSSLIISSGDSAADKEGRDAFLAAYDSAHGFEKWGDDKEFLIVGHEEWPMPIPLVRIAGNQWQFDVKAGEEEIINRRIGRNEINVIRVCRAYVEAQRDYGDQHHIANGQSEFAQHIVSSPGKHDGLYWHVSAGEKESPLGSFIARAQAEGYKIGSKHLNPIPYHGYYYKILTQQGENAPGGAYNFIEHGFMTKGYALIAFPAKYNDSGIMTFIVNQNGLVFEKNLGPQTGVIARAITQYNPDASWSISLDQ